MRGRGGKGVYPTSVQHRVTNEDSIEDVMSFTMMMTCEVYLANPVKKVASRGLFASV